MVTSLAGQVGQLLTGLSGWPVYTVVAVLVFLECAALVGMVLPGETAVVVAGLLAAQGHLSLPLMMAVGSVAAVAGDQVGFVVGRRVGPAVRAGRWGRRVPARVWSRVEGALAGHASLTVLAARFVPVLRAVVPTAAGALRMPYRTFLPASVLGGLLWVCAAAAIGNLAGRGATSPSALLTRLSLLALALLASATVGRLMSRFWSNLGPGLRLGNRARHRADGTDPVGVLSSRSGSRP